VSAHKPRILVIDDEAQIHRFLGPALEAAGYEPIHGGRGTRVLISLRKTLP
jgi:two-component system KDP operon response regulator KdpE